MKKYDVVSYKNVLNDVRNAMDAISDATVQLNKAVSGYNHELDDVLSIHKIGWLFLDADTVLNKLDDELKKLVE